MLELSRFVGPTKTLGSEAILRVLMKRIHFWYNNKVISFSAKYILLEVFKYFKLVQSNICYTSESAILEY